MCLLSIKTRQLLLNFTKLTSIVMETPSIKYNRNHVLFAIPTALNVWIPQLAKPAMQITRFLTVLADPVAQMSFTIPRHCFAMMWPTFVREISNSAFLYSHVCNVLWIAESAHRQLLANSVSLITLLKMALAGPVARTSFTTQRHCFAMMWPTFVREISTSAFLYSHVSSVCRIVENAHQQLLANSASTITIWKMVFVYCLLLRIH
jgi:hypothetical protein